MKLIIFLWSPLEGSIRSLLSLLGLMTFKHYIFCIETWNNSMLSSLSYNIVKIIYLPRLLILITDILVFVSLQIIL
jgi:hypothetical protein